MATQIENEIATPEIIAERQRLGLDRFDEVWDGEYMMSPMANNEHYEIASRLTTLIQLALGLQSKARIAAGANVSDQQSNWRKNYRCPDVVVVLPNGIAIDRKSYWQGGPDFVAEVISPGDRAREKFDFYAKVGSREFLLIDRDPWKLELYTLQGAAFVALGTSELPGSNWVASGVLPIDLRIVEGEARPEIEVRNRTTGETHRI